MGKTKKFVSKASSRTYKVVYRPRDSEADASTDDARAPTGPQQNNSVHSTGESAPHDFQSGYQRRDFEYADLGFPDDGYDYSQHLRVIGEPTEGLISTVLLTAKTAAKQTTRSAPSEKEVERQRRENPDLDEVLRALEDDEEEEEGDSDGSLSLHGTDQQQPFQQSPMLEDDFVQKAGLGPQPRAKVPAAPSSSARAAHSLHKAALDEQFEQLVVEDYDDTASEDDHSFGSEDREHDERLMSTFVVKPTDKVDDEPGPLVTTSDKRFLVSVEEHPEEFEVVDDASDEEEAWDSETIVTTYSNTSNHPTVIGLTHQPRRPQIILDRRIGAPVDYLPRPARKETEPSAPAAPIATHPISIRARGESREEKLARKRAVKEHKQTRRQEKSTLKKAFKSETIKQSSASVAVGEAKVAVRL